MDSLGGRLPLGQLFYCTHLPVRGHLWIGREGKFNLFYSLLVLPVFTGSNREIILLLKLRAGINPLGTATTECATPTRTVSSAYTTYIKAIIRSFGNVEGTKTQTASTAPMYLPTINEEMSSIVLAPLFETTRRDVIVLGSESGEQCTRCLI